MGLRSSIARCARKKDGAKGLGEVTINMGSSTPRRHVSILRVSNVNRQPVEVPVTRDGDQRHDVNRDQDCQTADLYCGKIARFQMIMLMVIGTYLSHCTTVFQNLLSAPFLAFTVVSCLATTSNTLRYWALLRSCCRRVLAMLSNAAST